MNNRRHSDFYEEEDLRPLINEKQQYYVKRQEELGIREKHKEFVNKYYGYFSLVAGLLLGAQVFCYQVLITTESENLSLSLCLPQFLGWFIVYGIYQIKELIVCYKRYGKLWIRERSSYYYTSVITSPIRNHDGESIQDEDFEGYSGSDKWNWFNICGLMIRTILGLGIDVMKFGVMYTATLAGVQYSLITNLYSIIPFLCSISFYIFFKERIGKLHILGMCLIMISLAIIAESQYQSASSTLTSKVSILIPLMLAVLASLLFTANATAGRYWVSKKQITIQQLMSDSYLLKGLIFYVIYCFVDYPYETYVLYAVACITVIEAMGMYLLQEAMIHGMAGPGYALHEVNSPFTLLLEIWFLNTYPSIMQIIGYVVGLIGGGVVALESEEELKKRGEDATDGQPDVKTPGI